MTKYVLVRRNTGTYRNNILTRSIDAPSYAKTIHNAVIMSRRFAAEQRQTDERLVAVQVTVA